MKASKATGVAAEAANMFVISKLYFQGRMWRYDTTDGQNGQLCLLPSLCCLVLRCVCVFVCWV